MKALPVIAVMIVVPLCYFFAQPSVRVAVFRPAGAVSFTVGDVAVACVPLEGVRVSVSGQGGLDIAPAGRPRRAAVAIEFARPVDFSAAALAFDIRASSAVECRLRASDTGRYATHASDAVTFTAGENWKRVFIGKKDLISPVDTRKIRNLILEFGMKSRETVREIAIKEITLLAQQ